MYTKAKKTNLIKGMTMTKKHRLLLGAHISIAGGIEKAFERGESIECTTMQLFSKSNRQWNAKPISKAEAEAFLEAQKKSDIKQVMVHATYLINLATPEESGLHKSIQAVKEELARCAQLNIPYLVLHPGSKLDSDESAALEQVTTALDTILEGNDEQTMILLEIMAGQGSSICYTFEQLAHIIERSKHKDRLGVCFDTCHAFAAGYDFSTSKGYEEMWQHFDKTIGINKLKAIHLNDSKKESGSHVDRHEEIGEGKIGMKAFELLMNDERFFDVPKVLETPNDTLEDYARNMKVLKSSLSKKNREVLGL